MKDRLSEVGREVERNLHPGQGAMILPKKEGIMVYSASPATNLHFKRTMAASLGGDYVFRPASEED